MVMQRWDPFAELRQMQETMNRMWRNFGLWPDVDASREHWTVPLDVLQEGDNIVVRASLPGVKPEDIEVTIENDLLTIKGQTSVERETREDSYLMRERRTGAFHRSLRLPDTVDTEKAESRYEHGVLTITFPKLEARKARHIKINVAK